MDRAIGAAGIPVMLAAPPLPLTDGQRAELERVATAS